MVIRALAMAVSSLVLAGCVSVGPLQGPGTGAGGAEERAAAGLQFRLAGGQLVGTVRRSGAGRAGARALSDNLDLRVAVARVSQAVLCSSKAVSTRRTSPQAAVTTAAKQRSAAGWAAGVQ